LLDRVLYWTNGHPYLTQRLCRAVADAARQQARALGPGVSTDEVRPGVDTVDRICEDLFLSKAARSTNDNLLFVRDRLVRSETDAAAVLTLYRRVRKGVAGPDDAANPLANSLRLAGVVRPYETQLIVRNRIYERVFDSAWATEQMPGAELRRQKEAFRRGVVRTTAFGVVILAVVVGLLLYALHQRSEAQQAARESFARSARLHAANGVNRLERGDLLDALPSLVESLRMSAKDTADEHIARIRLACVLRQVPRLIQFWKYEGPLNLAALSDDGRLLVTLAETNVVRIWDVGQGAPTGVRLVHDALVDSVAFNHAADRLLTIDTNGQARLWRLGAEGTNSITLGVTNTVKAVFSSDGYHVVTAEQVEVKTELETEIRDPLLRSWDETGRQISSHPLARPTKKVFADAERPRIAVLSELKLSAVEFNKRLHAHDIAMFGGAAAGAEKVTVPIHRVEVFDANTLEPVGRPLDHGPLPAGIAEATFSPDGRWLATACSDNSAWLWDLATGRPVQDADGNTPFRHANWVRTARFNALSDRLVTASYDMTARIWRVPTGTPVVSPLTHMHTVHEARFSRDGRLVVTASADNTATVWNAVTGERTWAPVHHNGYVMNAWLTPDGNRLISVGQDNSVRVSAPPPGLDFVPLGSSASRVADLGFSRDGRRLVTFGRDGAANVWDVGSGRLGPTWVEPQVWDTNDARIATCAISPDGSLVALGLAHGKYNHMEDWHSQLGVHGVDEVSAVDVKARREGIITALEFDPRDGKRLLVVTDRGTIEFLDATSGSVLQRITNGIPSTWTARFSSDGRLLATGSEDGLVQIWTSDGSRTWTNVAPQQVAVKDLAFTPDGTRLVFACSDLSFKSRAAYIWNFQTSQSLAPLPHGDGVTAVRVSPDGKRAATASEDGTSRLWDMETSHPLAQAVRHRYQAVRVAFDPDNRVLLSAGSYGEVKILDIRTAEPLALPLQVDGKVHALEFSPRGKLFVTGAGPGELMRDVRLWTLPEERRNVDELRALSELLSGNYIHRTAGPTQVSEQEVERLWHELRGKHPELRP
jgi:WD40 repeat protein